MPGLGFPIIGNGAGGQDPPYGARALFGKHCDRDREVVPGFRCSVFGHDRYLSVPTFWIGIGIIIWRWRSPGLL